MAWGGGLGAYHSFSLTLNFFISFVLNYWFDWRGGAAGGGGGWSDGREEEPAVLTRMIYLLICRIFYLLTRVVLFLDSSPFIY